MFEWFIVLFEFVIDLFDTLELEFEFELELIRSWSFDFIADLLLCICICSRDSLFTEVEKSCLFRGSTYWMLKALCSSSSLVPDFRRESVIILEFSISRNRVYFYYLILLLALPELDFGRLGSLVK